jgi:hypothetical protein
MMLNPNSFEKAGITAWKRIEDWSNTNDKLCNYKFPISEPVWKPKEKAEAKDYNIQAPKKEKLNGKMISTALGKGVRLKTETKPVLQETYKKLDLDFSSLEPSKLIEENTELERRIDLLTENNYVLSSERDQLYEENSKLQTIIEGSKTIKGITETILHEPSIISQKMSLDIEINLLVCGQKIQIKL